MSNRVHPMTMSKEGVEMAAVPGGGHTSLSLEEDSIDQQCMKHSPPDPGFFEKGNISNICTFLVMCAGLGMRFGMNGDWDDNVAVREWRGGESCGERARSPRHPRARSTILIFPSFTKENFARLSFFFFFVCVCFPNPGEASRSRLGSGSRWFVRPAHSLLSAGGRVLRRIDSRRLR